MATAQADERLTTSERLAAGTVPRVLRVEMLASALGAYATFRSPWTGLFSTHNRRIRLAVLSGVSARAAILIYGVGEYTQRREMRHPRHPTPSPA